MGDVELEYPRWSRSCWQGGAVMSLHRRSLDEILDDLREPQSDGRVSFVAQHVQFGSRDSLSEEHAVRKRNLVVAVAVPDRHSLRVGWVEPPGPLKRLVVVAKPG